MNDDFAEAFRDEARELLGDLEDALLVLEDDPGNLELVGRVFRVMHTIKGSGSMFGYDRIASFTHNVETVYDLVRNGKLPVTKELVTLSLGARDRILAMLDHSADNAADQGENERVIEGFRRLVPAAAPAPAPAPGGGGGGGGGGAGTPEGAAGGEGATYRIRFRPHADIFCRGTNPLGFLRELQGLGVCTVVAQTSAIRPLEELDPESCQFFWDVILTTPLGEGAIREVFLFAEDDCELTVSLVDDGSHRDPEGGYKLLGEILVERGDLTCGQIEELLGRQKRIGELAVAAGMVDADQVLSALSEQRHVQEVRQERQPQPQSPDGGSSIRVSAEKLDLLVNLVGELVTVQARLGLVAREIKGHEELVSVAEEVERLTAELRDNAMDIRMLPIGATFNKFKRLVRDLSAELGKEIELTTEGAETELDKTVIEKLSDPLVHIIRNSIDHGVERPEERIAKGKGRGGNIHLSAVHSGDSVLITVDDDGAGLSREAIRAKAIERKLVQHAEEMSDREIYALIFAPGFSTAARVSSVSGRGVGMDVVKQAIDALRGSIEVNSVPGKGTSITLKIPLTLAIIESLLVQIGRDRFVIPLSLVDECFLLEPEEVERRHGRDLLQVREQLIPYLPLRRKFAIEGTPPAIQQVIVCTIQGRRVGLLVDRVIGGHQTVIKSLGPLYQRVAGVSGATILGDGCVALILDVAAIVRSEEYEQSSGNL